MNILPQISNDISDQKGFSLIEVMFAMVILAFGVLAMAAMQIYAFHGNEFAWERTEAVTLATQHLEELRKIIESKEDYENDPDLANTDPDGDGTHVPHQKTVPSQNGRQYDFEWTVTEDSTLESKFINLTVSWDERGQERTAKFNYILAKLGEYSM